MTYLNKQEVDKLKAEISFYKAEVKEAESVNIDDLIKESYKPNLLLDKDEQVADYQDYKAQLIAKSKKLQKLNQNAKQLPITKRKLTTAESILNNRYIPTKEIKKDLEAILHLKKSGYNLDKLVKNLMKTSGMQSWIFTNSLDDKIIINTLLAKTSFQD